MKLKIFLRVFGCLAILLTLIPFIAINYWWIRVFDFPHLQLTFLTFLGVLTSLYKFKLKDWKDVAFTVILTGCLVYQVAKVFPYTSMAPLEIMDSTPNSEAPILSIYASNVLQSNKKKEKLLAAIEKTDVDILLFTETDTTWRNAIHKVASKKYPHYIGKPLPNTYGMLLYSKLPLINPEVRFIVDDSVPSIQSLFLLPSGDTIQLFAIHPSPPMPQHNPSSTNRDAEMMKTALDALTSTYPVLVMGDFNDVSWSKTNRTFQQVSRLLDPRRGRGFYNSYHTGYFFMRWPLDHFFVSEQFRVSKLTRETSIDSDHFPMSIALTFEPEKAASQKALMPDESKIELAKKQIRSEEKSKDMN